MMMQTRSVMEPVRPLAAAVLLLSLTTAGQASPLTDTDAGPDPPRPENISCISENWNNMLCTWDTGVEEGTEEYNATTWSLFWSVSTFSLYFYHCPHAVAPNQCLWKVPDGLDTFKEGMVYRVVVQARNQYGRVWSALTAIDTKTIVKPDPVSNIGATYVKIYDEGNDTAKAIAWSAVGIKWDPPTKLGDRLLLSYEVKVTPEPSELTDQPAISELVSSGEELTDETWDNTVIVTNRTWLTIPLLDSETTLTIQIRSRPLEGGFTSEPTAARVTCFRVNSYHDATVCVADADSGVAVTTTADAGTTRSDTTEDVMTSTSENTSDNTFSFTPPVATTYSQTTEGVMMSSSSMKPTDNAVTSLGVNSENVGSEEDITVTSHDLLSFTSPSATIVTVPTN